MSASDFPVLCRRVRGVILKKYGPVASVELVMLLDLIEMLWIDKADRVKAADAVDSSRET
jgi:hypothetical protein